MKLEVCYRVSCSGLSAVLVNASHCCVFEKNEEKDPVFKTTLKIYKF